MTFTRLSIDNAHCPHRRRLHRLMRTVRFLGGVSAIATISAAPALARFDPYPVPSLTNDFGGVGLLQTPTARFAPDGQFTAGFNKVSPYDRYFVTFQAMPWLEATLRYTSVSNRLYSQVPEFSGNQNYKDRGFDIKVKLLGEGRIRPALAIGARDFVGTGLFGSEYIVASKSVGPFDASFGIGWGNIASRGNIRNPFSIISDKFDSRGISAAGTFNNDYFKGRRAALFGGVQYATPIRGLTLKLEYDPNDYQTEALGNRLRDRTAINAGLDYRITSWLHAAASYERGNKVGLTFTATTNFNRQTLPPKFDPPGAPVGPDAQPIPPTSESSPAKQQAKIAMPSMALNTKLNASTPSVVPAAGDERLRLASALAVQGVALYAANFGSDSVELFVTQTRFRSMATGLGRIARAAFAVLPAKYTSAKVVFVENGVETISATVPRAGLIEAIRVHRGPPVDALLAGTKFENPPLNLGDAEYQGPVNSAYPRLFYSIRPGLKTTIGRPEQFLLYQAYVALNGGVLVGRGLGVSGQVTFNISDNFDKLRVPSNSLLPRVRSDIAEYLRQGKTALAYAQGDYNFNIAPSLYGHVYGGLLEEMFAGVGGEMLYRPALKNWAIGAELSYVQQRDYDQLFNLRNYKTLTGYITGYYSFPRARIDTSIRIGRYLAKDYGATFEISRTFDSGVRVGAFATFTDVSAAEFGEGRFDKGIYLTVPLDLLYNRHVRSSIGVAYRPLIRDGGQQLIVRQPLIGTTDAARKSNFVNDWQDVTE